ncbi:MAG: DUF917 domain-containing protein [Thermoprotei archaeon]
MIEIKTLDQVESIVLGSTILGTGGGGDPKEGFRMLKNVINSGHVVKIVQLNELHKDTIIVVPYNVGSIAPGLESKKITRIVNPIKRAIEEMESFLNKKVGGVVASELGGSNTPAALSIAAELGLPAVDGDLLGRAAPELHQCTVHIFGIPMYPAVIVTKSGNIIIVKEYADIDDYEAIARHLSVLEGKFAAVVDTPMNLEQAKKAIVQGTITFAMKLGENILKARKEKRDPVLAAVKYLDGWKIFEGIVKKYTWESRGGFLRGEAIIEGKDKFKGRILRSWIMNEHILAWIDDKPIVMPPDLLMFLENDGNPITNSELREGMFINAITTRAPKVWRTSKGLELFGPRHFGFDYDYVPVEELIKEMR